MNNEPQSFTENDLHAYVDQRLDPARRAQIEAWLETHPAAAERVRAYREQNELLHAAFDGVVEEAVPERVQRPRTARWGWMNYGGLAASLVLGVALGWLVRGESQRELPLSIVLPKQAALAHVLYTPEVLHPVEVGAEQEEHLVKWLSKRLGVNVQPPHLQSAGFTLEGGRLLPSDDGPAAQFMYRDSAGLRLTLYLRTGLHDNRETAFRYAKEDAVSVFYWVDGSTAYALSGELDRERLLNVAQAVYRGINP